MDNWRLSRVKGSTTALASATKYPVQVATEQVKVYIRRVKLKHTAGAAANFTPRIFKTSTALNASIDQEFVGSATVVADLFDVFADAYTYTDTDGYLFLTPGPDAGVNNTFDYEVYFNLVR